MTNKNSVKQFKNVTSSPALEPYDFFYQNLKLGTNKQKKAYGALVQSNILKDLKMFTPILAGTIPLDIDTEDSDLDITCETSNLNEFKAKLDNKYRHHKDYCSYIRDEKEDKYCIANFTAFEFEIFGKDSPTLQQAAIIHMQVEKRLLDIFGEEAKKAIRELKKSGLKTEPAFAKYFNLDGNPYQKLLELSKLTDTELIHSVS